MQEDTYTGNPNDPLSLNLYTYCHNEPVMYVDPSGNTEVKMRDLVNAAQGTIKRNDSNSSITVTINGVTKTFQYGSFKLVSGSAVIDMYQNV